MVAVILVCHFEGWKHQEIHLTSVTSLDVKTGDTFSDIALRLRSIGVIQNVTYFEILARMSDSTESIQAGEYSFSGAYTPARVLQKLVLGRVVTRTLKMPEGGNFKDFVRVLENAPKIHFDIANWSVETALDQIGNTRHWDQIPSSHGEGWFFPDTYQYATSTGASDILRTAHIKMIDELREAWDHRNQNSPLNSPYELLILASIVEKESGVFEDQKHISGVFSRRLIKGMRLQADPTVIYGLGDVFTGNLTRVHLNMENPYNTYRNYGLPPTPIAAPSRAALQAAAQPAPGNTLYFVARGDGTSEFSETLEEHNRAVRKYQLNQEN